MYKPLLYKRAAKYYQGLDPKKSQRINQAIAKIIENPLEGPHVKKLRGSYEGKYRYAVGNLRIVYEVDLDKQVVLIEAIGPRGDIYK